MERRCSGSEPTASFPETSADPHNQQSQTQVCEEGKDGSALSPLFLETKELVEFR